MSRRRMQGLTRTGRQVSEDPDLEGLLSELSLEELEQLKDEVIAPEPEPIARVPAQREPQQTASNNILDAKTDSKDSRRLSLRERSFEGEPKKESRKQEYLRKMGLSQEGKDSGLQRQASISGERENKLDERNHKGQDCSKEDRAGLTSRYRRQEAKDNEVKVEGKEREKTNEDTKLKDRWENRESTSSKTKDMITKLQKTDDVKEKEKRDDYKKKDDSKTKELISKLQDKTEKDSPKPKDRKEGIRTSGLVSKMLERQNQVPEPKVEEKKSKGEDKDQAGGTLKRQKSTDKGKSDMQVEKDDCKVKGRKKGPENEEKGPEEDKETEKLVKEETAKETEKEKDKLKRKDSTKVKERTSVIEKETEVKKENGESKGKSKTDGPKPAMGNCVANKEEEEEDEDSSMFDELMEQVSSNDPAMTELIVNNSEVIKTKTLIQFAEALRKNTHIKSFALANCRADDHVAYAIAGTLRDNKTLTSINLDSNHLTSKGIISLIQALKNNATLTELRFHNQRHICGGKTEMEMTKVLKDNTTLLKLGYHFELAGPRMTMTNILSRNMDRQRQRRLQEQKQAQANGGDKKETLGVPKPGVGGGSLKGSPMPSPKPSPRHSPMPSPKLAPKRTSAGGGGPPPPPPPPPGCGPPPPPPPPMLDMDSLKNSLTPVSQRKSKGGGKADGENQRDQLLASIRDMTTKSLKKVPVPKYYTQKPLAFREQTSEES